MCSTSFTKVVDKEIFSCGITQRAAVGFPVLLTWLFLLPSLFAAGDFQQFIVIGEKTILLGSAGELSTGSSQISASDGQYVRLMPGTHIRQGDNITINIISREHHQELLAAQREDNRQSSKACIIRLTQNLSADPMPFVYMDQGSLGKTARHMLNNQYQGLKAQLLSRVQIPDSKLVMAPGKSHQKYRVSLQCALKLTHDHRLLKSWGERPENIKVMLS